MHKRTRAGAPLPPRSARTDTGHRAAPLWLCPPPPHPGRACRDARAGARPGVDMHAVYLVVSRGVETFIS